MSFIPKEEFIHASLDYQKNIIPNFNMEPNYVIKLPLEEQAKYADNITIKYCHDERFTSELFKNFKGLNQNTNACSIGNLAYLAREHNNEMLLLVLEKLRK